MQKQVKSIYGYSSIDNLVPGVRGQRAFPTRAFRESDPFLMLDHIGPEKVGANYFLNGEGHDHPHKGFETLSFLLEGTLYHRDSLGNEETLTSGSVQRMNAGSGIIHGGDMASDSDTGRFHSVQLWVNNPSNEKNSKPGIHNVTNQEIPFLLEGGAKLRVIAGTLNGLKGKIKTKATTQIGHLIAEGKSSLEIGTFPNGYTVMVYVLEGEAEVGNRVLREHQLATLEQEGDSLRISTSKQAQLLILSGAPLNEPIAFGGPFVMNTQEEIRQAQVDYELGRFGIIQ
ncbi:pirin family protein [bacterium SCSIO 12741]|nr:pirin family protein [bacterium SCSIO 12741]